MEINRLQLDHNRFFKKPMQIPDMLTRDLDQFTLIYRGRTNNLYELNKTAGMIWKLCDGNRDLETIADKVAHAFEGTHDQVLEDVRETVKSLHQLGLLKGEVPIEDLAEEDQKNKSNQVLLKEQDLKEDSSDR